MRRFSIANEMLRKEDKVEEGGKNIRGCENRCEDEFARRRKFAREKEESLRGRKRFTLLVDMERLMTLMFFQDFFFQDFWFVFFFARRFLRGDFCEEIFISLLPKPVRSGRKKKFL